MVIFPKQLKHASHVTSGLDLYVLDVIEVIEIKKNKKK